MIGELTIAIICQWLFNITNAYFDAYRILKNKNIAHGLNFGMYLILVIVPELLLIPMPWYLIIVFCIQAFLNRQITFDIPLNLRRGLEWDYISLAKPPKAITDRIEIAIFGYNGRAITITYMALCLVFTIFTFILS